MLSKVIKGYGYRSLAQFKREFNLTRATIDWFRRDPERLYIFMKEKVETTKIPKGATHVDMNTGVFYKKGRFDFIYWHGDYGWDRCNRIGGLKGLDKIKFYEYEG